MRTILIYSVSLFLTGILLSSCKPDPCGETICHNGGVCVDGACLCPDGWAGEDCSVKTDTLVAHTLEIVSGNNQTATFSTQIAMPLVIRVLDQAGGPHQGVVVHFQVVLGGGFLGADSVVTNSEGEAETYWTLGDSLGTQQVEVYSEGLVESPVIFNANTVFQDSRDGKLYSTITVGTQIWMAENLRYEVVDSYLNPSNPTSEYGRLYTWNQTLTACPSGWHLPSDWEWSVLEIVLGMDDIGAYSTGFRGTHGTGMKSMLNWNGTNSSGLNILPTGLFWSGTSEFINLNYETYFWTSTEDQYSPYSATCRNLHVGFDGVNRRTRSKSNGFSCRCIKD